MKGFHKYPWVKYSILFFPPEKDILCDKIYNRTDKNKKTDEKYGDCVKCLFCTASFEFSEIFSSRNDRESGTLWLKSNEDDDDHGKYANKESHTRIKMKKYKNPN